MRRVVLFITTNLAIMLVLSVTLSLLGINRWLTSQGINFNSLLIFSLVAGFSGAIISLLISKFVAKWSTRARVIDPHSTDPREAWLIETVSRLAERAGIGMPEVAVFEGQANAFATGAFKNNALVAVSTGLLQNMDNTEVEAVLGHEVAHIANGDMVTMTLIQGVVNTFVFFLARVVGYFVDRTVFRRSDEHSGPGFYITVFIFEMLFGLAATLIVAWFSRQREYRADSGSARLLGNINPMIQALERLQRLSGAEDGGLPKSLTALGINSGNGIMSWFASHPPISLRIASLRQARL